MGESTAYNHFECMHINWVLHPGVLFYLFFVVFHLLFYKTVTEISRSYTRGCILYYFIIIHSVYGSCKIKKRSKKLFWKSVGVDLLVLFYNPSNKAASRFIHRDPKTNVENVMFPAPPFFFCRGFYCRVPNNLQRRINSSRGSPVRPKSPDKRIWKSRAQSIV